MNNLNLIYLDSNSTSPVLPEIWDAMQPFALTQFGNPSSSHGAGRKARKALEDSREEIAQLLGAFPDEVVFTSGATEANNLALQSALSDSPSSILASQIEHASITEHLKMLEKQGFQVQWLETEPQGKTNLANLSDKIKTDTKLATLMLVNHETGVLQPIETLGNQLQSKMWVHTDAVQGAGKIRIDFHRLCVTSLALSAHKFHGPKGIGALLVRRGSTLKPMLFGGHQQKSLRPGTEPVHLVVGMALALKLAMNNLEARRNKVALLRESFLQELRKEVADFTINGEYNPALPFTLNLGFPGLKADILLMRLDMAGVACSTGSACSSGSLLPSPVLMAMQVAPGVLKSSMRFSFGFHLEEAEVIEGAKRIAFAVQSLRNHAGTTE